MPVPVLVRLPVPAIGPAMVAEYELGLSNVPPPEFKVMPRLLSQAKVETVVVVLT